MSVNVIRSFLCALLFTLAASENVSGKKVADECNVNVNEMVCACYDNGAISIFQGGNIPWVNTGNYVGHGSVIIGNVNGHHFPSSNGHSGRSDSVGRSTLTIGNDGRTHISTSGQPGLGGSVGRSTVIFGKDGNTHISTSGLSGLGGSAGRSNVNLGNDGNIHISSSGLSGSGGPVGRSHVIIGKDGKTHISTSGPSGRSWVNTGNFVGNGSPIIGNTGIYGVGK